MSYFLVLEISSRPFYKEMIRSHKVYTIRLVIRVEENVLLDLPFDVGHQHILFSGERYSLDVRLLEG